MARRRRRSHAKENPEHMLLLVGLGALVVVGGVGIYLYSQSQALSNPNNFGAMGAGTSSATPASSSSSGSSGSSAATPAASSSSSGS